jgi:hypothetical protein
MGIERRQTNDTVAAILTTWTFHDIEAQDVGLLMRLATARRSQPLAASVVRRRLAGVAARNLDRSIE